MASLQKIYSKKKLEGQVYTPDFIVKKILDDINYNNKNILGKTILEPSCGDGQFLVEIAKRIIKFSSKNNLKDNLLKIYAWDTDKNALQIAENKLNKLIEGFNISIKWNVFCKNSILQKKENNLFQDEKYQKFNFIVGNPPYIRIQHLEKEQRIYIQNKYKFCKKGSTDIYIAFFELAENLLEDTGICGFITPNTFFNTDAGKNLRQFFEKNQNIIQITNYGAIQLFNNATTYSAITVFSKKQKTNFLYQEAKSEQSFIERKIDFLEIRNFNFWQLSAKKNFLKKGKRLGDICDIHVGLTTLSDKIFILKLVKKNDKTIILETFLKKNIEIEKEILKPIIKASKLKTSKDKINKFIIFPYKKINGKNIIIKEIELKEKYPLAYKYLLASKEELEKRDNGKKNPVTWYAFGRNQSLDTSFGKKILFSPINKKPNFIFIENQEITFYSGYCIKYTGDNYELLKKLNSKNMENFIKISSRDFRGEWKAYNKKIVQEFRIR